MEYVARYVSKLWSIICAAIDSPQVLLLCSFLFIVVLVLRVGTDCNKTKVRHVKSDWAGARQHTLDSATVAKMQSIYGCRCTYTVVD